jgi:hypothetical protein
MLDYLFDTTGFLTRTHCGPAWTETLAIRSQVANLIIWFAYTTIPFTLAFFLFKSKYKLPNRYIITLFAHFIFLCGITHFNDFLVFHYPMYRFFVLSEELTALASLPTAIYLPLTIVKLLRLPSFEELRQLNIQLNEEKQLRDVESALCDEQNKQLKAKVDQLEHELKSNNWLKASTRTIEEIKTLLET